MKLFRPNNRGEWPRADLRNIHSWIETSFERRGADTPHVVAIAFADHAYDNHLYETFFELAPGVIASAKWTPSEEEKEEMRLGPWPPPECDAPSIGAAAAGVARHYLSLGTDHLADLLHDLRVRVRRRLAELSTIGGGPRLVSLRLTGGDWLHADEFNVILRVECLDEFLFAETRELLFEDVDLLDEILHNTARPMAERYALRHALAGEGATGTIDLITLNAASMFGDVRLMLRALGRGIMPWASNMMEVFGERGNLWSYGRDPATRLSWRGSSIGHPTVLPASVLMAYAGHPVTDLITHPMLSDEMTIISASRRPDDGALLVEFEQPRRLFCHQSGRTWVGDHAPLIPANTTSNDDHSGDEA